MHPFARAFRVRPRRGPSPAERRAHAEAAIDRYLGWCAGYAAALTRKSEREAAYYALTGEPASPVPGALAGIKRDATPLLLAHYRAWLAQLRDAGLYDGPVVLKRQRPDGSWTPLVLDHDP